jgi:hypothetical protein
MEVITSKRLVHALFSPLIPNSKGAVAALVAAQHRERDEHLG